MPIFPNVLQYYCMKCIILGQIKTWKDSNNHQTAVPDPKYSLLIFSIFIYLSIWLVYAHVSCLNCFFFTIFVHTCFFWYPSFWLELLRILLYFRVSTQRIQLNGISSQGLQSSLLIKTHVWRFLLLTFPVKNSGLFTFYNSLTCQINIFPSNIFHAKEILQISLRLLLLCFNMSRQFS